ncbi:hypothetical protein K0M31_010573 [Melipona bicolor]|uniref:Uncharacterized protein n=1 Tax=Melipona bicolor TaxID=60889 RepID=A0AA40KIA2_9HYME|nr:hypothetical protein K0M31_010573 [Melipona bicolor]
MYQRTVDELQDELNSFEQRLSASATGSYKRKIYDLEAICCADLNRVKSRFVRSLQAFGNTIDSIEELRSLRINPPPPSPTKSPLTGNNTDACRHGRPTSRNAKHDRSLPRSKSIVTEGNRSLWLSYICAKRYSDSEMYSKIYRSLKYSENPQIANTKISDFNLRHHRSITTIFPSNLEIYHTFQEQ